MAERISEVGYINEAREHAMISVYEPAILNASTSQNRDKRSAQIVIEIDTARKLLSELETFFENHDATD